jgi:hypothetical protein
MLQGHRDLRVYQLAYKLAMEIFHLSKLFWMLNPEKSYETISSNRSESLPQFIDSSAFVRR